MFPGQVHWNKTPGNWKAYERSSMPWRPRLSLRRSHAQFTGNRRPSGVPDGGHDEVERHGESQIAGMIPGGSALISGQKTPLENMHSAQERR